MLVSCASSGTAFLAVLWFLGWRLLLDDIDHLSLDGFLLEHQSVLVPDEVRGASVELVSLHAAFE